MSAYTVCLTPGCPQSGEELEQPFALYVDEVVLCGSCGQARTLVGELERIPLPPPGPYSITTAASVPPVPMLTFLGTSTPLPLSVAVWRDPLADATTASGLIIATELEEGHQ